METEQKGQLPILNVLLSKQSALLSPLFIVKKNQKRDGTTAYP